MYRRKKISRDIKQKTQLNELGLSLLGGVLLSQGETPDYHRR